MLRICLAAFLAAAPAVAAAAQSGADAVAVQPSFDAPQVRETLRTLSVCLARYRPNWAQQTLALPYLSTAQARAASEVLNGSDRCLTGRDDVEVTFRTSSMIASLAEYYLRDEMTSVDWEQLVGALDNLDPRNASEDFAYCVSARNPTAARDLALSPFGSTAETDAARRLGGTMAQCFNPGESRDVDLQSLRALTSTSLYRGVKTLRGN